MKYISWRYRVVLALIIAVVVGVACRTHAYAAPTQWPWTPDPKRCGATDAWACATYTIYTAQVKIAEFIWQGNRVLLILARYIETVREWLVGDVLGDIFDSMVRGIQFPFWIAVGIAWILYVGSKMLTIIIDFNWVDLRKTLKYIVLSLLIFHVGSSAMAGLEQFRVNGSTFFASMAEASTSTALKINSDPEPDAQMPPPKALYSGSSDAKDACNTDLSRKGDAGIHLNDYTGNYLFAGVKDIHCPGEIADRPNLPDVFARGGDYNGEHFDGYFPSGDFDTKDDTTQQKWMALATTAITRLFLGIPLGIAAIFEQTLNLVYALGLAALCFGATISLLVALFIPGESLFKSQIDALFKLYKNALLAALWTGILMVVINQGATKGSSLTVAAFGLVAALAMGALLLKGMKSTAVTFAAMSQAMGGAPAAIISAGKGLGKVAMDGALIGGALATGGAGMLASTAIRRAGRDLGASSLGRAAGRTFTNTTANRVNAWDTQRLDDKQDARDTKELAWYESRTYADAPLNAPQQQRVATLRAGQQQRDIRRSQQHADIARRRGDFATADAFVQAGAAAQRGDNRQERAGALSNASQSAYADGRNKGGQQLAHEGRRLANGGDSTIGTHDTDGAAPSIEELRHARNTALRNKRWDEAREAIAQIRRAQGSDYIPPRRVQQLEEKALNAELRTAYARGDDTTVAVLTASQRELQADMRMNDARSPAERAAHYQTRLRNLQEAATAASQAGNTAGAQQLTKAAHRLERQLGQGEDTSAQQQWDTAVERGDNVGAMAVRSKVASEYFAQAPRQRTSPVAQAAARRSAMGSSVLVLPSTPPQSETRNSATPSTTASGVASSGPGTPASTASTTSASTASTAPAQMGRIRGALPGTPTNSTAPASAPTRQRPSVRTRSSGSSGGESSRVMDTSAAPVRSVQPTPSSAPASTNAGTSQETPLHAIHEPVGAPMPASAPEGIPAVPSQEPSTLLPPVVTPQAPLTPVMRSAPAAPSAPVVEPDRGARERSAAGAKPPSLSQQMLQAAITPPASAPNVTPDTPRSAARVSVRPSTARMTKSRVSVSKTGTTKKD